MVYYGSFSSGRSDPLSGDRRHVFLLGAGLAIIVKFISDVGFATLKILDTRKTSLERTMSSWRTRNRYDASIGEVMSAYTYASEIVAELDKQVKNSVSVADSL